MRRTVLSDLVVERLQEYIRERGLQPGDSLPTEQRLVAEYGVSRTVIREAVRVLIQRGLVNVSPGRGMTVAKPSIEGLAYQLTATLRTDEASSFQLFELRELLEPAIAKAAALARTEEDIEKLELFLQRTEENLNDSEICVTCDIAFHQGLAEATHNPFYALVTLPVAVVLDQTYRRAMSYVSHHPATIQEHRSILDAVIAQDAAAAEAASLNHLRHARARIKEILQSLDSGAEISAE